MMHMDDRFIFAKENETLNNIVEKLKSEFEISLSEPSYFVGLQIQQNKDENSIIIHINSSIEKW